MDRQTDAGQSDPYVPLCFAGDTTRVSVETGALLCWDSSSTGLFLFNNLQTVLLVRYIKWTFLYIRTWLWTRVNLQCMFFECFTLSSFWDYNLVSEINNLGEDAITRFIHVKLVKFKRGRSPSLHLVKEGDFARNHSAKIILHMIGSVLIWKMFTSS